MSFFGKLARGVATGLGNYEGKVADQQIEDEKARVLMAREQALAAINSQSRLTEIAASGAESRATHASAVVDDVARDKALLPSKTQAQIVVNQAKIDAQTEAEYKLLPAKTRATLTIEQYKQAQETARNNADIASRERQGDKDRQVRLDTNPIATTEAPDGTPVISYAPGATTRETKILGAHMPRHGKPAGEDDLLGDLGGGTSAPSRPAAPSAMAAPRVSGPDTAFRTAYANANPDKAPGLYRNGQKIPLSEAWSLFQGQ